MDNMRLRVLYSIRRISLWYEAHHREIPVDAKTVDGRDNLRRHNRLEATFIYVHCSKKVWSSVGLLDPLPLLVKGWKKTGRMTSGPRIKPI
jgi:hypothetical protein